MNPIVKIIIEDTPTDATNETKLTTASTIICLIFIYTVIYEIDLWSGRPFRINLLY